MRRQLFLLTISFVIFGFLSISSNAKAQQAQVRGILFFSPSCGHCHMVISEVLPPLAEKYGEKLQIAGVDVSHEVGQMLYQSAIQRFEIPENRLGVPTLIIGETVLVGSLEIPEKLPGIIETGLNNGGIDWPDIPGLDEIMSNQQNTSQSAAPTQSQVEAKLSESSPEEQPEQQNFMFVDRFNQDPIGNSFSVIVLIGMIASVIGMGKSALSGKKSYSLNWPNWVIPVLSVIGLAVAAYLSFVEVTASKAICGPVGDCNTVQESPYALLFGILPIGVMGLVGYMAILLAWVFKLCGNLAIRKYAALVLWGMAWFGILFSIYLTFLEPFIIGATCAWCLTSAIIMTLIFIASTEPAKHALFSNNNDFIVETELIQEFE